MKRLLVTLTAVAIATFAIGQDMMQPIPKEEMNAIDFLMGKAKGDLTFNFGPTPSKGPGTWDATSVLGGRYQRSMHTYTMDGQTMEGMHMLTWDPAKKKYVAWWFDSAAPGGMEMEGDLKDGTLQMTSKPTEMPGSPEKIVMRATWKKLEASKVNFTLEMQQGTSWMTVMEGVYTKG